MVERSYPDRATHFGNILRDEAKRLRALADQLDTDTGGAAQSPFTPELMNQTTVSCSGEEITIQCNNHDVKDALMDILVDGAYALPSTPAQEPMKRQYYYRVTGCKASGSTSPDCICWHDEGTGPYAGREQYAQDWRTAPALRSTPAQAAPERGNLTKLAAECHRAKWEFDFSEDYTPSRAVARALVLKAFAELHRIGDMALKLRDGSAVSSTDRVTLPGHDETMANLDALTVSRPDR